ncbi:hypothetical protein J4Q44_G00380020 [Coregonus suidteri]|uniref:Uncharacterized protein n=1 Tax=Coregonus suidteri TaxID=861788 RepID=A0AAN8KGW4_9TELE
MKGLRLSWRHSRSTYLCTAGSVLLSLLLAMRLETWQRLNYNRHNHRPASFSCEGQQELHKKSTLRNLPEVPPTTVELLQL